MIALLRGAGRRMAGLVSVLLFLLLWEAAARVFHVRAIMLPLPGQVALELASEWSWYAGHAAYTLMTTLAAAAASPWKKRITIS